MNILLSITVCAVAPVLYAYLGSFCVTPKHLERKWLSPFIGVLWVGWVVELGFVLGLPVSVSVALAIFLSGGYSLKTGSWRQLDSEFWRIFGLIYLITLACVLMNLYPAVGYYSGDWLNHYQMGLAIFDGQYASSLLERPPLMGAATAPLFLILKSLSSFQVLNALISAAVVLVFNYAARTIRGREFSIQWLLILTFSAANLYQLITYWPKYLAAGCLLLFMLESYQLRKQFSYERLVWAAVYFGFATAAHYSSIIYAPVFLALMWNSPRLNLQVTAKAVGVFLVAGIIYVGPFELWSILEYGLHEKISRSPAVSFNKAGNERYLINTVATMVGWLSVLNVSDVGRSLASQSPLMAALGWGFYVISNYLAWATGTVLGILLPFVLTTPKKLFEALRALTRYSVFWPLAASVLLIALLVLRLNAGLCPLGVIQVGLNGVALALFVHLGLFFDAIKEHYARRFVFVATCLLGLLPFAATQLPILLAAYLPEKYSSGVLGNLIREDSDAAIYFQGSFESIAQATFPVGLVVVLLALLIVYKRRQHLFN